MNPRIRSRNEWTEQTWRFLAVGVLAAVVLPLICGDTARAGERKFVLEALLAQEPAKTFEWLARECRTWAARHRDTGGLFGTVTTFWGRRAETSSALLDELSREAGLDTI